MSAVRKTRLDELTHMERLSLGHFNKRKKSQKPFDIYIGRLREIEMIIRARHGRFIPQTDDADLYIESAILSLSGQDMQQWCKCWAPWAIDRFDEVVTPLLMKHSKRRYMQSADDCADMLNLTMAERTELGIKTIGASDLTKTEREKLATERKREQDRTRAERKRKAAGVKDRASYEAESLSQTKPWEALNMTRATWYRKGKPTIETSQSRVDIETISDTPVSPMQNVVQTIPPRPLSIYTQEGRKLAAPEGSDGKRSEAMPAGQSVLPPDGLNLPSRPSRSKPIRRKAG